MSYAICTSCEHTAKDRTYCRAVQRPEYHLGKEDTCRIQTAP